MTFKDAVADDMRTYLNRNEFADVVTIQGKQVLAVLSMESAQALEEWRKRTQEPPGVGVRLLTLTVAVRDLDRLYAEDVITLDDAEWTVLGTADELGVWTIHLYRYES